MFLLGKEGMEEGRFIGKGREFWKVRWDVDT